ncbi:MAG: N-acetyl-gamma-glutamyl-phosphate reductase [Clostridia bacterium]|nr:N-acetyl-gamma-glutamyl-phosphate reductase [Clostridia bacterium]
MKRVFIDGSAGTTGLRIAERLAAREDLTLIRLPEELRKDPAARKDALNAADAAFLCLPDDAAREAAAMAENESTVVIDTSTAHRTAADWTYGFPELTGQREKICAAKRIANPGCHATGFISLIAPLTEAGILPSGALLSCFSLTGYSGGGKKMIAEYESEGRDALLDAPRQYGLGQTHKHLPEMKKLCGLENAPVFCPVVAPYYAGMEVTVPLFREQINSRMEEIREVYRNYYRTGLVRFIDCPAEGGFLSAGAYAGRDDLEITVAGSGDRILLISRFDNLGKGASGAAIQNMNLALGMEETGGLVIGHGG